MTPLDIPKIQPSSWDEWWKLWHNFSDITVKNKVNHNPLPLKWRGLDLYTNNRFKEKVPTNYLAPHAPSCPVVDDLIDQIRQHLPLVLLKLRVIENLETISPHADQNYPKEEYRSFLWNEYESPVWEFEYHGEKRKLVLPEDTNTWCYTDYPLTHASDYIEGKSKGVLIIYGIPIVEKLNSLIQRSAEKYKSHAWII